MRACVRQEPKSSFSISNGLQIYGDVLYRFAVFINKPNAEIAHARAVDDCTADDVLSFIEREPFGNTIIHDHAAITGKNDSLLAVEPPHGGGIRADGYSNAAAFLGTVHDGNGPEENSIGRFVHPICEAKQLYVELRRIQRMPQEFLTVNSHPVAVARDHS